MASNHVHAEHRPGLWRLVLLLALPLALTAPAAQAQKTRDDPVLASTPLEEIQRVYLECDRAASQTLLDTGTAAQCSQVSEALLQRGFGGDFNRLLAWWRGEKQAAAAGAAVSSAR